MRFGTKDSLTKQEIEQGLNTVIKDGLTSQAMVTLTSGVFLVAFALKLGASNMVIGLLAAIPLLTQLIQIPSIYLIERIRVRRAICVVAAALSRFFWLIVAVIPLVFSLKAGLAVLIVSLLLYSAFSAVVNSSWNSWMRDLVPLDRLGAFFSRRMRAATVLGVVLSLAAAFGIDYWRRQFPSYELHGYSILFISGFLAGMLGVLFISRIPEPRMSPTKAKTSLFSAISLPFRDNNFRNLIWFLGSWNFAVNLAAPFFTVYMLKRLELGMSLVIALTVLSQLISVAFLRIWGGFSDRFSNKSVLGVSGPLFMISIFAWTFTTLPEKYALTMPLLIVIHALMGVSTAGVTLAAGNIGLKLAPRGQATSYLAATSFVNSLAAGVAPILGGKLADFFTGRELALTLKWTSPGTELLIPTLSFKQWDFFFFFAFIIGLYSIHRFVLVKEVGEVEEKIIVRELIAEVRRPLRNFSTAGGLLGMAQFPLLAARQVMRLGKK